MAAAPNIQAPRICDRCENPLPPYRWSRDWPACGGQCKCQEPKDPVATSEMTGDLERFITRDLQVPRRILEEVDLDAIRRMRVELGTSPLEMAAEQLEDARLPLREAMKLTDCTEHRDLHLRLGNLLNELDDFRSLLMERCS